jgi:predicted HTH transcriptional regulator
LNEAFAAESDKGALAKALSAFANADGGVIVYGLEAKRDKEGRDVVRAKKPLKDAELVRSRVLGLVGQLVQPPVEGIEVEARNKSRKRGYVLVYVPPSDSGPHRARMAGGILPPTRFCKPPDGTLRVGRDVRTQKTAQAGTMLESEPENWEHSGRL